MTNERDHTSHSKPLEEIGRELTPLEQKVMDEFATEMEEKIIPGLCL